MTGYLSKLPTDVTSGLMRMSRQVEESLITQHMYFYTFEHKSMFHFRADHKRKNEAEGSRFLEKLRQVRGLRKSGAGGDADDVSSSGG